MLSAILAFILEERQMADGKYIKERMTLSKQAQAGFLPKLSQIHNNLFTFVDGKSVCPLVFRQPAFHPDSEQTFVNFLKRIQLKPECMELSLLH